LAPLKSFRANSLTHRTFPAYFMVALETIRDSVSQGKTRAVFSSFTWHSEQVGFS